MKYLKIAAVIFGIGLFLQIYAHINLMVSFKYEVDHMETFVKVSQEMSEQDKVKELKRIEERKFEIKNQQKQTKVLFWFFLSGLIVILYFLFFRNRSA